METKIFSNETLDAAMSALNACQDEIVHLREQVNNAPVSEVIQKVLMERLSMTQLEAEEVCEGIQKGVDNFTSLYSANAANEKVNLRDALVEATTTMNEEEKSNYLSAVLTAIQVSQDELADADKVSDLQAENAKQSCEDMIDEIERLMNESFPVEKLASLVDANADAEAIITLSNEIAKNKDEYRYISALMLYILQYEGKIKLSDTEVPFSAEMLGALACVGTEAIVLTGELEEGKIDLKRWQTILKWIIGAFLGCALGYFSMLAVGYVAATIVGFVIGILGTSTIALLVATAVGVYVSWNLAGKAIELLTNLLDLLGSVYDKHIEPLTKRLKALATAIKVKSANFFNKAEETDKNVGTDIQTAVQGEPEVTTVQVPA